MKRLVAKLAGFATPIVINAVLSLLTIPALVTVLGTEEWARVAVAQSAGALGAVVVGFGWNVTGPATAASLGVQQRGTYFASSVPVRTILFLFVAPLLIGLVWLVAGPKSSSEWLATVLISWGMAAAGLSAAWFFVAEAAPWRLVLWDLLPRAVGTLTAVGALILTQSLIWFSIPFFLGYGFSAALASASVLRRYGIALRRPKRIEMGTMLRDAMPAFTTAATSALYANVPLMLLSVLNPSALTVYALADKIYRFTLTAVQPVNQIAQGYVPAGSAETRGKRLKVAAAGTLVVAVSYGAAFILLGPWLAGLLSGNHIQIPLSIFLLFGIAGMCVIASRFSGLTYLVLIGETKTLARSTVLGAIAGVVLTLLLATAFGGEGVASAIMGAEILVIVVQIYVIFKLRRTSLG